MGMYTKHLKMADEWHGNPEEFSVWHVLLGAYLASADKNRTDILKYIVGCQHGKVEEKLVGQEKVEEFLVDHGMDPRIKNDLQETLFITLLQFTGGDIKARVHCMGECEVFQAYRWLCHRGRGLDEKQKIELRSRVLNPEAARGVGDVDAKMAKWKADIAKLTNIDPKSIAVGDRVQPFWSLLPDVIQDHLMSRGFSPEDWENYDKVEMAVEGFLRRWRMKGGHKDKNRALDDGQPVNAVDGETPSEEYGGDSGETELDWQW